MPEGPFGGPRITNMGPLSRESIEDVKDRWELCSIYSQISAEICESYKFHVLKILNDQGILPEAESIFEINSGKCSNLAVAVYHDLDEDSRDGVRVVGIPNFHIWIKYKDEGEHHDARNPSGTPHVGEMNIMDARGYRPTDIVDMIGNAGVYEDQDINNFEDLVIDFTDDEWVQQGIDVDLCLKEEGF